MFPLRREHLRETGSNETYKNMESHRFDSGMKLTPGWMDFKNSDGRGEVNKAWISALQLRKLPSFSAALRVRNTICGLALEETVRELLRNRDSLCAFVTATTRDWTIYRVHDDAFSVWRASEKTALLRFVLLQMHVSVCETHKNTPFYLFTFILLLILYRPSASYNLSCVWSLSPHSKEGWKWKTSQENCGIPLFFLPRKTDAFNSSTL